MLRQMIGQIAVGVGRALALVLTGLLGFAVHAAEPAVKVVDTIGGVEHDFWARSTAEFCHDVMSRVFAEAGLECEHLPQDEYAVEPPQEAEFVCSLFRTPRLLTQYLFPLQPLSRMRFALYAPAKRAAELKAMPIVSWPRLKVAYSPVLQGVDLDREHFFAANALQSDPVSYPTSVGAVDAVVRGEADVLFLYTAVGQAPTNLTEILEVGQRNVYFGVRKDKVAFFDRITKAYRRFYVREIAAIDALRERHFGTPPPTDRVRIAAYEFPSVLSVTGDGVRLGLLSDAISVLQRQSPRAVDWVYGSYAESLDDVEKGRLDLSADLVSGDGFCRKMIYTQQTLGRPRIALVTPPEAPYEPNRITTWRGMRLGILEGVHKNDLLRRRFDAIGAGVELVPFARDSELFEAYRARRVDAALTAPRTELAFEKELLVLTPDPVKICVSSRCPELAETVDRTLSETIEALPGLPDFLASRYRCFETKTDPGFSVDEIKWLEARHLSDRPVTVAFTPSELTRGESDAAGGFTSYLFQKLSSITGLEFKRISCADAQTSRRLLLDGVVELWSAYPYRASDLHDKVESVFAVPVPQYYARRKDAPKNTLLRGTMAIDRHDVSRIKAFVHRQSVGNVVLCDGVEDCYKALLDGRADCLQCSMPDGDAAMTKLKFWDKVENEVYLSLRHRDDYELMSGPGVAPELVSILRKALYSISADEMRSFFLANEQARQAQELAADEVERLSRQTARIIYISLAIIGGLALVSVGVFAVAKRREARREREARVRIEEANKARQKFLSAVSHDVRTPLNAILGFSELLSMREGNDAEMQEELGEIVRGGRAILGLMDDIAGLASGADAPDVALPVGAYAHPLVVDDSSVNLDVMRTVLAKLNVHDVAVANDGQEALELLQRDHRIDIVFTDLWMAPMGGEDLVRHLRSDARFATLPVYAVSADAESVAGIENKGFNGAVVKPVNLDQIRVILSKLRGGGYKG